MVSQQNTFALFFLAAVSTVANYAGLSNSIFETSFWWLAFCAAVSLAVGIAIFVFWSNAFEAAVKPQQLKRRGAAWIAVFTGVGIIIGMSTWWNVAALGGKQAQQAGLNDTIQQAETVLATTWRDYTGYKSLLPALNALSGEIGGLAECEGSKGCVTGAPGKSGVYQILGQLKSKTDNLMKAVQVEDRALTQRASDGAACLKDMRKALSAQSSNAVADATDCVNGALADIAGNALLQRIADDMNGFTVGIVLPVSVSSAKQKEAVSNIFEALGNRAADIARSAKNAVPDSPLDAISIERMSAMKAVAIYYDEVIPSWLTGMGLDLLPLVLLLFKSTMAASRREEPDAGWHAFTAGELLQAAKLLQSLKEATTHEDPPQDINSFPPNRELDHMPRQQIDYKDVDLGEPEHWEEWIDIDVLEEDEDDVVVPESHEDKKV